MKSLIATTLIIAGSLAVKGQAIADANNFFDNQRYSSARALYHQVLKSDPVNAEAWLMLTRSYLLDGQLQKANDSFALVPTQVSTHPYIRIAAGSLAQSKADTARADQEYNEAMKQTKSKDAKVMGYIAAVNIESSTPRYQYSIDLLDKAIKRDKKNPGLYTLLGQAYRRQMNGSESYRALMQAIDHNAKQTAAYYELARLFNSQGNKELTDQYLQKAIASNPSFAPAYYDLYQQTVYTNPGQAKTYFEQYRINADYSKEQDYYYTDLLYLNKSYDSAIAAAQALVSREGDSVQPRMYKLLSYSFQEKADTAKALEYMATYFQKEVDSNLIPKDYETMGLLYNATDSMQDSAMVYFEKAYDLEQTPPARATLLNKLMTLAKASKDFSKQAYWMEKYYNSGQPVTNVTLFDWGIAAFRAEDYAKADSVFGLYSEKYADQPHGYYWRARVNAAIDTSMSEGLAIPHYKQLIDVLQKDSLSATDKKWMTEAYGYLATYEANTEKDYAESIDYFEKLLEIDPENKDAKRYIDILEKNLEKQNKVDGPK